MVIKEKTRIPVVLCTAKAKDWGERTPLQSLRAKGEDTFWAGKVKEASKGIAPGNLSHLFPAACVPKGHTMNSSSQLD